MAGFGSLRPKPTKHQSILKENTEGPKEPYLGRQMLRHPRILAWPKDPRAQYLRHFDLHGRLHLFDPGQLAPRDRVPRGLHG